LWCATGTDSGGAARDAFLSQVPGPLRRGREKRIEVERPDLNQTDPAVRAYIEALEAELERLRQGHALPEREQAPEPSEPPTTLNVITISAAGVAKRTPRHLYGRQRRGGMGIFDLETREDDPPALLTIADESQELLLFTTGARVFQMPVRELPETPVRGRGESLVEALPLKPGERLVQVLPDGGGTYLALLSQLGYVLPVNRPYLRPGDALYDTRKHGSLAAAC
jgi:DNA gyrase/topoisomerase IV subunit A